MQTAIGSKAILAQELGVSISSLYYRRKLPGKDRALKIRIEEAWRYHPSYGHRRLAIHLGINKKRIRRVMKIFDLHPYRRRGKKPRKSGKISGTRYLNLVKDITPQYEGHIWAADFTYLSYKGKFLYVATVIDLFTRKIIGWAAMRTHSSPLVLQALFMALSANPRPYIFHSDNGSEYASKVFVRVLTETGVAISRIAPGCPWENGYQESFYASFKIDLGDPNRFSSLGELVYETAKTIWTYNYTRIHTAIK
ncbi:MAG: integrase catalytic subunit, partial [Parcubacteria group bacterium Gr01-1014_66]